MQHMDIAEIQDKNLDALFELENLANVPPVPYTDTFEDPASDYERLDEKEKEREKEEEEEILICKMNRSIFFLCYEKNKEKDKIEDLGRS